MPGATLSIAEMADELGRSTDWVYDNWRTMCKRERLPHPLHDGSQPLRWSRAQVYAWLDRNLEPRQRAIAAAHRAAADATDGARPGRDVIDEHRAILDDLLHGKPA